MDNSMQTMTDIAASQTMVPQTLGKISNANGGNVDKTSKDFESMFMSQMLQPMFEGIGVDETFGGGHGEEVMRNLLVQEYGKVIAKNSPLGIADSVKSQMLRKQGLSAAQTTLLQGA